MAKLKKSSNNKANIIFIYGPIAVGKLTVAITLSKKLGYKLTHNHALNDFVDAVFDRGTLARNEMVEKLRYDLLDKVAKTKVNLVTTHAYAHNYVSKTGLSDPKYVETLEKRLTKLGANFFPVHLKASDKELIRRAGMPSRKKFRKISSRSFMRSEVLSSRDYKSSPKLKNNLIIDNTELSPVKVSQIIIKHFRLK